MKRSIIQIYAIVICIVAVIAFLISFSSLISSFIDYLDPLNASRTTINLSSKEYFKMDLLKSATKDQFYIPSDEEISRMFEAAKDQHIQGLMHRTYRSFIVSIAFIVISVIMFLIHWKVVKKYELDGESGN